VKEHIGLAKVHPSGAALKARRLKFCGGEIKVKPTIVTVINIVMNNRRTVFIVEPISGL
jgi:hypothetical protein